MFCGSPETHTMYRQMILILFTILCFLGYSRAHGGKDEPVCTSQFDYDRKMLRSLLLLEIEQEKINTEIKDLKLTMEKQKDSDEKWKSLEKDIGEIFSKLKVVNSFDVPGSTYIRWGKTACPGNGTEMVYKGFAAGSLYTKQGAASSYLCLPEDPTWNVYDDTQQASGTVWGAEYETHYRNENAFFGKSVKDRDVPCSVCRTTRTSVLMIPGRHVCYDGWTTEYHGYLMSGHEDHRGTDYVCVDEHPETLPGGEANDNGKLFYFTEGRCGSLRCPPYVDGRELTCSVCSK